MLQLGLILASVFALLCISELLWRHKKEIDPEYTRKFVHITVGSFVAFWPLFLNRDVIVGLSAAFVVVVLLSQHFKLFRAIRSVQRPTWGEVLFAVAVGLLAYVSHSGWIYLVSLLHMSLADGLAATIGIKFGKLTRYYIFGHPKSVVGTGTFIVVSFLIFAGYCLFTGTSYSLWFVPITFAAAVIENLAVRGLDNLLVPLLVAVGLNLIRY